jgi:pimeloyl-ACP methyl ester carboxylesterase
MAPEPPSTAVRRPTSHGITAMKVAGAVVALVLAAAGCTGSVASPMAGSTTSKPTGTVAPSLTPAGTSVEAPPTSPSTTAAPADVDAPPSATAAPPDPTTDPNPWLRARLSAAGLPVFDGAGDFYAPPSPLPPAPPGTLIRVATTPTVRVKNADAIRVMYHSQDRDGHDVAVTGTVTIPHAPAPAGGRPLISWAHGTTGIGAACAPSKETVGEDPLAQHHVDLGYVWAATDYYGLGPPGLRHPYLSGVSEAHAVIDIVRATRAISLAAVTDRWLVYGHSQGGQAALFTGELAPTYAPELHLLGTVAAAPASFLPTVAHLPENAGRVYVLMMLLGLPTDYPALHAEDYLTPKALALSPMVDTGCGGDIAITYKQFGPDEVVTRPLLDSEPMRSILLENDPGRERTAVPILLTHGADDLTLAPSTSATIFDRLCGLGQTITRRVYPGTGHSDIVIVSTGDVDAWMTARMADQPAPTTCPAR